MGLALSVGGKVKAAQITQPDPRPCPAQVHRPHKGCPRPPLQPRLLGPCLAHTACAGTSLPNEWI